MKGLDELGDALDTVATSTGAEVHENMHTLTVGTALRRSARDFPDVPFVIDGSSSLTFAETDRQVDSIAQGLLDLGLGKGTHIGLMLVNSTAFVLAFLACARIGAVVVPLSTRYKTQEARNILDAMDVEAIIIHNDIWGLNHRGMMREIAPHLDGDGESRGKLRTLIVVGGVAPSSGATFDELLLANASVRLHEAESQVEQADLLLISSTSGTTGNPKGVMHTHRVLIQSLNMGQRLAMGPATPTLGHGPFYHAGGLFIQFLPSLLLGSTLVVMDRWDGETALELIERYRIEAFGGGLAHYTDLVDAQMKHERDIGSLQGTWIGGNAIGPENYEIFTRALGLERLMSGYGMTENTIATTFNRWDDPPGRCCSNQAPLFANCELAIVDPDTLQQQPRGAPGEIWCRGETVMEGYYRNPSATSDALTPDGWLRTGDIGVLDDEGYLAIVGRLKEMLKIGGTNAYCADIEAQLQAHPAVSIAVVVGVPDPRLDEVPYAFLTLNADIPFDEAELRAFCRTTMASYKVPRFFEILDQMPRMPNEKYDRVLLKRQAEAQIAQ
ncbi:MAG: acyl--CoA ligase [Sphingopyxis sp.]|nr:acyl--CoA ligase [Sphingopyxis sp.]